MLFGGFQDTAQQTKYLQDLWIYDCQNFVWYNAALPPAAQKPDARSSFSFHPHEGGAVIFGGYSRIKSAVAAGKQLKGGIQGTRTILKPVIHQDTWFLRITQPPSDAPALAPPTIRWERRKKPANAPNPPRAGATMAYHKGRGILFGGVHDVEESEEGIESEFFDTLFAWNIERNRYFQLTLRRPRATPKRQVEDRNNSKRDRGKADEAELLRNLAALETRGIVTEVDATMTDSIITPEEPPAKPCKPKVMIMPRPRFNAQLATQDDVLYIFGGTYEHGDREYTFDEMWAIDLGKLDGVQEIYKREPENWQGSDDDDDDSDSESTDENASEDEDMDGEAPAGVPLPQPAIIINDPSKTQASPPPEDETLPPSEPESNLPTAADDRPHPRPFETLREFFTRTSTSWQAVVLGSAVDGAERGGSVKEVRKSAFEAAEVKWWDCREEITALEDEQEEAGIGEVVSFAGRGEGGGGVGGAGRRR